MNIRRPNIPGNQKLQQSGGLPKFRAGIGDRQSRRVSVLMPSS